MSRVKTKNILSRIFQFSAFLLLCLDINISTFIFSFLVYYLLITQYSLVTVIYTFIYYYLWVHNLSWTIKAFPSIILTIFIFREIKWDFDNTPLSQSGVAKKIVMQLIQNRKASWRRTKVFFYSIIINVDNIVRTIYFKIEKWFQPMTITQNYMFTHYITKPKENYVLIRQTWLFPLKLESDPTSPPGGRI